MRRCTQAPGTGLALSRCEIVSVGMMPTMTMLVSMLEEEEVESGGRAGEEEREDLPSSYLSPQSCQINTSWKTKATQSLTHGRKGLEANN